VESCRNESELSSGTSALLFNQSCLNINAPEASGVIKELPLTDSTTNEYYFPIAEIYIHYREDLEKKKQLMETRHWNFKGAFFFVVTVFTTIGYGNVAPSTKEGRLVVLLTTIPLLAISLITIVTIAEPIIDSMDLFHVWILRKTKKKLPIDITIPQKCTMEHYFGLCDHHLVGEAFWPMTEVFVRINQIYTQDERHKKEVFLRRDEFVETCQRLRLSINDDENVSPGAEVSSAGEEEDRVRFELGGDSFIVGSGSKRSEFTIYWYSTNALHTLFGHFSCSWYVLFQIFTGLVLSGSRVFCCGIDIFRRSRRLRSRPSRRIRGFLVPLCIHRFRFYHCFHRYHSDIRRERSRKVASRE